MANRWFTQFVSTLHKKPAFIDCSFLVGAANANGYGASSLKGGGVSKVYMHTTASFTGTTNATTTITGISSTANLAVGGQVTGTGIPVGAVIVSIPSLTSIVISLAATNSASETIAYFAPGSPRPAAGLIYVSLQDNWNQFYWSVASIQSPLSGTSISISTASSLVVGNAYTITAIGTTTLAQWNAIGVPTGSYQGGGVTGTTSLPTVGTTFIASATSGSGTGTVQASVTSGIDHIELIGDPNQIITAKSATALGFGSGAYLVFQAFSAGTLTAPVDGTRINLGFFLSNSSILVKGD